jgi:hypothetical protein
MRRIGASSHHRVAWKSGSLIVLRADAGRCTISSPGATTISFRFKSLDNIVYELHIMCRKMMIAKNWICFSVDVEGHQDSSRRSLSSIPSSSLSEQSDGVCQVGATVRSRTA